jgi:cytochrome c oxidase subunit 4
MKHARIVLGAWLALVVLLMLTVAASFAPLGPVLPFVSYGIAIAKTAIVLWEFMEMKRRDGLQRLALASGFVWTMLLLILLASDSATRGWLAG